VNSLNIVLSSELVLLPVCILINIHGGTYSTLYCFTVQFSIGAYIAIHN